MAKTFQIERDNLALGVLNTSIAIIRGVTITNEYSAALDTLREEALVRALAYTDEELATNPILQGYRDIYHVLGYAPREVIPAAEGLIALIRKRRQLPRINPAVDAYNTVVLDTLVGIGAHDLAKVDGSVLFTRSMGTEEFTPLGSTKRRVVPKGDFLYRDDTKILARLAEDDCDQAKLSIDTNSVLLVIEGNANTPLEYTAAAIRNACERITRFCSGTFVITHPDAIVDDTVCCSLGS
jgi:DNA/RNA-binding domain of Phe-tRNA-synthetase-like protein